LSHNILFVAPGPVLPLFHFQFLPPIHTQGNVSSSLKSCLSIFLMYCPFITLFSHFFL
jgi:hypothetical protein